MPSRSYQRFHDEWSSALETVKGRCECDDGECPRHFDYGVVIALWNGAQSMISDLPRIVEKFFHVERWSSMDHHEAHARLGFHASPFQSALILSYDAGGNDGWFIVYAGEGQTLNLVKRFNYNLGHSYNFLATFLPEVSRYRDLCSQIPSTDWMLVEDQNSYSDLKNAGKLMGYAATGEARPEIRAWVRRRTANPLYC